MSLSPARSLSPDPHPQHTPGTLVPWYPGTLGRNRESKSGALSFFEIDDFLDFCSYGPSCYNFQPYFKKVNGPQNRVAKLRGRDRKPTSGAISFSKLMFFCISVHMALLAIISSPISKK